MKTPSTLALVANLLAAVVTTVEGLVAGLVADVVTGGITGVSATRVRWAAFDITFVTTTTLRLIALLLTNVFLFSLAARP